MPNLRTIQRSFAGGEMSPSMHARVDDVRFQNGYASARNFEVLPNGSLNRRPGLRHVRRCKFNDKRCRLIPFRFSIDQALMIEMGHLYIRFHQNGGPLLYATPFVIQSTSSANDTIRFTSRPGLANNTAVTFTASAGGTIPGGLVEGTIYYVINDGPNTDAKTIQVSANPGPGAAFNIDATAGVGTSRMFLASEMPPLYFASRNFVPGDVNTGTDEINLTTAHGFVGGEAVRFTTTAGLPMETSLGQIITQGFIIVVSATVIKLSATIGGPAINIGYEGSGTHKIHRFYADGDLIHWIGAGHGVFLAFNDVASDVAPPADTDHWWPQPEDGVYELDSPFTEDDLDEVTYDQSNDVISLTHRSYVAAEVRREAALRWTRKITTLAPQLAAPVISSVTPTFGAYQEFTASGATPSVFQTTGSAANGHGLLVGDSVYVEAQSGGIGGGASFNGYAAGYYEVMKVEASAAPNNDKLYLKTINGGAQVAGVSVNVYMRYATLNADTTQRYKVTAVTEDGLESQPSSAGSANNNLSVSGSSNLITFAAVTGAAGYRVYKEQDSTYGFIGESDAGVLTFKDGSAEIAADLSRPLPRIDTSLNAVAGDYPGAVAHFEQRRFFGGTTNNPNRLWATRSGTESDLIFHIPVLDDDRLKFELAGGEAVSIRHLVPWKQLLILTNSTEFRVVPVNSETLTPSSIDAKTNSYQGCSVVRPAVASGNLVFCANRGGHVFEMGYAKEGGLSDPGDLCFRSSHLFDGLTIVDQAQSKAPHPILWFCSSNGLLIGLTYVPQEQIGAWHAHDTAASGVFESCGVIPEGDEDARYFVVRRTIGGSTVRSVEVMSDELYGGLRDAYFVDAGGSFDGTNTGATTMTITGGVSWVAGETVAITSSTIQFVLGSDDVGDRIVLMAADGSTYAIRITSVTTPKIATGTLLAALPAALRSVATTAWAFARDTITGLDHLEGQTVQVFGDGLVQATRVVSGGAITPATPAVKGCVGLGMPATCTLLPIGLQIAEAFGQGRTKNVNQAAIRVVGSGAFRIGPDSGDASDLVPAIVESVPGSLVTGEARATLMPEWSGGGQITLRIDDPLPMALLGVVLQVAVGD